MVSVKDIPNDYRVSITNAPRVTPIRSPSFTWASDSQLPRTGNGKVVVDF